uniref:Uncharacterized protein n=1 Tax=Sphaerodactylus townsendi TaxID=933632 RepID=A0ACB8ENT3_9SAUR
MHVLCFLLCKMSNSTESQPVTDISPVTQKSPVSCFAPNVSSLPMRLPRGSASLEKVKDQLPKGDIEREPLLTPLGITPRVWDLGISQNLAGLQTTKFSS